MDDTRKSNTQIERALKYFELKSLEGEKSLYTCSLCKQDRNGTKKSNLLGHLKAMHNEVYQSKVNDKSRGPKVDLCTERLKMMQHFVELTTIDKQQFMILSKPGFKKIVSEKLKVFEIAGIGIDLEDKNLKQVKTHVHETADKIRIKIKNEVRGKLISMSTDIASKNNRSFLGVFIQYFHDGQFKVRCIGMKELKQRHTGKYLSSVIKKCMEVYGIQTKHIISLTTDNAGNMRTLVKNMNECLLDGNDDEPTINLEEPVALQNLRIDQSQVNFDDEIAEILHQLDEDDEREIDMLFNDDYDIDNDDDWQLNDLSQFDLPNNIQQEENVRPFFIDGVNCAAHTLQLAVKDALSKLRVEHSNVIKLTKACARFIRKESTRNEAINRQLILILPTLDVTTRWSFTYMMLRDILKCENIMQSFKGESEICMLLLQKMEVIKEIVHVLKVAYQATIVMQKEDFKLSDFFATWEFMEIKLRKYTRKENMTGLAKYLLDMLAGRKSKLMETTTMSAAIALDPRFCSELDEQQKQMAITTLENLWDHLESIKGQESISLSDSEESDEDITIMNTTILNKYCKRRPAMEKRISIKALAERFISEEHILLNGTIHDFWKSKKDTYSELFELAEVILAISPTQVVVERAFSTLSYVFNFRRSRLTGKLLEDILVISLNSELFYSVNRDDLDEIITKN